MTCSFLPSAMEATVPKVYEAANRGFTLAKPPGSFAGTSPDGALLLSDPIRTTPPPRRLGESLKHFHHRACSLPHLVHAHDLVPIVVDTFTAILPVEGF